MFDTRTRLSFFDCLKDAAGAALKNATPTPTSKKIGSGSGSATLKKIPNVATTLQFFVVVGLPLLCCVLLYFLQLDQVLFGRWADIRLTDVGGMS